MAKIRTILFPTDFSEKSSAPLEYVRDLARRYKSRVVLLHVIESLDEMTHFPLPEKALHDLARERLRLARKKLREFASGAFGASRTISLEVAEGQPYHAIVELARKKNADIIIMGTHGRGGLAGFLLGSNAEKVIKTAPCPVLTVKGKDKG